MGSLPYLHKGLRQRGLKEALGLKKSAQRERQGMRGSCQRPGCGRPQCRHSSKKEQAQGPWHQRSVQQILITMTCRATIP